MTEPMPFEDIPRRVARRGKLSDAPDAPATVSLFLPGRKPELNQTSIEVVEGRQNADGSPTFRLDFEMSRRNIGVHAFPPGMTGTRLDGARKLLTEDDAPEQLQGMLPDHLELEPYPFRLDKSLAVPPRIDFRMRRGIRYATTVFPPDNRYTFNDTAFPWSTCGRVSGPGGTASGAMVGPRHLLTASHAIRWINPPNPFVAEWVKFTPSYFDSSEPFGSAFSTHVYWQQQVTPPTISGTESQFDYVVVVLDRPIGNLTGWIGTRSYNDSWDGSSFWSHIGYPGDLAGLERPSFQGAISLNGDDSLDDAHEPMYHQGDVWPGQSGGPFFGWWDGEHWPRAVGTQSWQNTDTNGASGGSALVDLVIRARNEHQ
jgi:V8-like Glu-specific endopeptidase